jgi:hypothetical protein
MDSSATGVAAAALSSSKRAGEPLACDVPCLRREGLRAAVAHDSPQALYLNGSWRPAGTFEYPPAFGLLQVCALPVG